MADAFISYSSTDLKLAQFLKEEMKNHEVTTFLANIDLKPGEKWAEAIWKEMEKANWAIFLASKDACKSAYVQQEFGIALQGRKEIIVIMLDIDSDNLPGWMNRYHALDFRGKALGEIQIEIEKIANEVKVKKTQAYLIFGLIMLGLFIFEGQTK